MPPILAVPLLGDLEPEAKPPPEIVAASAR